jgi:PIN domain nuclease of toxin-antitoxin system
VADYVIDASSVLAFAFNEQGSDIVEDFARHDRLMISSVNVAEILAKLDDKGWPKETIVGLFSVLCLDEIPFDAQHSALSAKLRTITRQLGLSLGDRCCLALALKTGAPILTADRSWTSIADALGLSITITRD